jgi:hypothetical protein
MPELRQHAFGRIGSSSGPAGSDLHRMMPRSEDGLVHLRLHTRVAYDGKGIGLAICQKIIEPYGGRMWVDAHAGPGATFKLTLPAAAQPAPEQPQGAVQP